MDRELPGIIEDAELTLSGALRTLLSQLKVELDQFAERIAAMDRVIQQTASEHEGRLRMQDIPGIGPLTATAIVAAIGTGHAFGKERSTAKTRSKQAKEKRIRNCRVMLIYRDSDGKSGGKCPPTRLSPQQHRSTVI